MDQVALKITSNIHKSQTILIYTRVKVSEKGGGESEKS